METDTGQLLFLPHCTFFANHENFYHRSLHSGKIEIADFNDRVPLHQMGDIFRAMGHFRKDPLSDAEILIRSDFLDNMQALPELFSCFFSQQDATWNTGKQYKIPE